MVSKGVWKDLSPELVLKGIELFGLCFETILGLTCRVFLPHRSVTHGSARPHFSGVKLDISTP